MRFSFCRISLTVLGLVLAGCAAAPLHAAAPVIRWRQGLGAYNTVAVSHNEQTLAVFTRFGNPGQVYLQLWNLRTGQFLKQFPQTAYPESLVFSHDDQTLYTATGRLLTQWDTATGHAIMQREEAGPISLQADGDVYLVIANADEGEMQVRRNRDGEVLADTKISSNFPLSFGNRPDEWTLTPGHRFLEAGGDLWDLNTGQAVLSLPASFSRLSPDGKTLMVGDSDIDVYEIVSGELPRRIVLEDRKYVQDAYYSDGGAVLNLIVNSPMVPQVPGSAYSSRRRYRVSDLQLLEDARLPMGTPVVLKRGIVEDGVGPSDGVTLLVMDDHPLHAWIRHLRSDDLTPLQAFFTLKNGGSPLAFSPSGRYVAAGGLRNTAHVLSAYDGSSLNLFRTEVPDVSYSAINALAFSPDERVLVTGHGLPSEFITSNGMDAFGDRTEDNTARVWDVLGGKLIYNLPHEGPVYAVDYAPDGQTIATGSGTFTSTGCGWYSCGTTTWADNAVRLWRVTDGQLDRELALHQPSEVTAIAYSPDAKMLVSGNADGSLHLWRVADGAENRAFAGPASPARQIVFTSDGALLRVRFGDGVVRSWRVSDGEPAGSIPGLALSPAGVWVAQSPDEAHATLEIRRADDGGLVKAFDSEVTGVIDLVFSRDGRYFSYVRSDGQMITADLLDLPVVKGDLNGDGAVNILDAVEALRFIVGLASPNAGQQAAGDVDGNEQIDLTDVILILQVAVGVRPDFEPHTPQSDDFFTGLKPFWTAKQPAGATPLPAPSVQSPDWGLLTLTSADNDIWLGTWEPYFVYQYGLFGDFTMRVTVHSVPECGELSAVGLMVAQEVPEGAGGRVIPSWGLIQATRDYGAEAKWGGRGESETSFPASIDPGLKPPYRLRLDRRGSTLSFYVSKDGNNWTRVAGPVDMAARGWNLYDSLAAGIVEQTHCGSETMGTALVAGFQAGPLDTEEPFSEDAAP